MISMDVELKIFFETVERQEERKRQCINLIASENIISNGVRELAASLLSNRYILDDFPNNRGLFYIQKKLEKILCEMFQAKYVSTSPLSGMNCMELIISSLSNEGDNIYIIKPSDGGHSATRRICSLNHLKINFIPFDHKRNIIDIKKTKQSFKNNKPNLIYLDNTIITFYSPIRKLKEVAAQYQAPLIYDGSHVLGLIAGKSFPNPLVDGADVLNGSTHKTFFGAQKGIIVTNNKKIIDRISLLSKDYISSIHTGSLLSLYLSALEMKRFGREYAQQVVKNSKALAQNLYNRGVSVPARDYNFTDTHQVLIDTKKIDTWEAFRILAKCHINVNPIRVPAIQRLGLRLGTAEVTRLGMKEKEMAIIADFIADALYGNKDRKIIRENVIKFCNKFRKIHFTLDEESLGFGSENLLPFKNHSFSLNQQHYKIHKANDVYTVRDYDLFVRSYAEEVFKKIPGFQGMIIRGSLGRGVIDEFSDIDFTCIFDRDIMPLRKKYNLKLGMHQYRGIMFSGRYISLKDFKNNDWSGRMKHAYSYVRLISCSPVIEKIIREKTKISKKEQVRRIVSNIIELGEICKIYDKYREFKMFSEIYKQYKRGEVLTAHLEIDRAIRYLKNIIFDLNRINYPEEKNYYTHFFSNLTVQPKDFDVKINKIIELPRNESSLGYRVHLLLNLSREVISLCERRINLPKNIYDYFMNG